MRDRERWTKDRKTGGETEFERFSIVIVRAAKIFLEGFVRDSFQGIRGRGILMDLEAFEIGGSLPFIVPFIL